MMNRRNFLKKIAQVTAATSFVAADAKAFGLYTTSFWKKRSSGSTTLTISASSINPNISTLATAAGWNGTSPLIVNITAPLINTLQVTSSFPGGITINISASTRVGGVIGGNAMTVTVPVSINNLGIISGGGGYGGGGQGTWSDYTLPASGSTRSWGSGGAGGSGEGFTNGSTLSISSATGGGAGDYQSMGSGWAQGGSGGSGGTWGQAGTSGSFGSWSGVQGGEWTPATSGGSAGLYLSGNSNVTWIATGTRLGGVS